MNVAYVIRWKSKVNGRAGRGSKRFARQEAERLADELNREYPDIEHDVIEAPAPQAGAETDLVETAAENE